MSRPPQLRIEVIVPRLRPRRWQLRIVERLRQAGHTVSAIAMDAPDPWSKVAEAALRVERRIRHADASRELAAVVPGFGAARAAGSGLRLDLSGRAETPVGTPTLSVSFAGELRPGAALTALAGGRLPDLELRLDGEVVAQAAPMVDNRILPGRGFEDVLARAVTLVVDAVGRIAAGGPLPPATAVAAAPSRALFATAYLGSTLPRVAGEMLRRTRYRSAHWRVGYRFTAGAGVAATGRLGEGWRVLPDDGSHFFADPFPLVWQGRHFVFVEDFPHATGKAVISVTEIGADGRATPPCPVLEEPHHLSYPQVFEADGAVYMLPEASAGRELVLYRAEDFPSGWRRHAVLFADRELSDATLVHHNRRLWLFATERDGYGSTSDTLVVFHAPRLAGPWTPHPMNPIAIDRAAARPGGAVIRTGDRLLLPLQDGTRGYGRGLGLAEIRELSETVVRLTRPIPIGTDGDFPYPQVHTLNRHGRLEVIDGIAAVRK